MIYYCKDCTHHLADCHMEPKCMRNEVRQKCLVRGTEHVFMDDGLSCDAERSNWQPEGADVCGVGAKYWSPK
jgi:hypothetical protein